MDPISSKRLAELERAFFEGPLATADADLLLELRARRLSEPAEANETGSAGLEVVVFRVRQSSYGVPLEAVVQVRNLGKVGFVPDLPVHWGGLVAHQGRLVPLVDLAVLMGEEPSALVVDRQVVLLRLPNGELFGLICEEILGTERTGSADRVAPLSRGSSDQVRGLIGWVHLGVQVLDPLALSQFLEANER